MHVRELIGDTWGKKPVTTSKESHYIRNAETGSASTVEDTLCGESWQHLKS